MSRPPRVSMGVRVHPVSGVQDSNQNIREDCKDKEAASTSAALPRLSRRPDIDLIRVVLTWGILLYHTVLIYTPDVPYYVKILPDTVTTGYLVPLWFIISMNAWNMPMFFFLSGIR